MAEYIELTEELKLSMRAGARAILNTKKYHGTIYMKDAFSDSPKEIPYLQAAEILYIASEKEPEDVAPVAHGRWEKWNGDDRHHCTVCECYANAERDSYGYIAYEFLDNYCPNCGARMDFEEPNEAKESRQP